MLIRHRSEEETRFREYRKRKRKPKPDQPNRVRSVKYLNHVRGKPCLHCGLPGQAHHIQYAQPRALQLKTGDQYVVPLCATCHASLHTGGIPERTWWALRGIDPIVWAEQSYENWGKR